MVTPAHAASGPRTAVFDRLALDAGALAPLTIAYETYGTLDEDGTNAVLVCHALTGNAHAGSYPAPDGGPPADLGWWDPLIGPGRALDTDRCFVVCSNILGSCYGTTGPTSLDPASGLPYGPDFPAITVRDMVRAQRLLLDRLGVRRLLTVVGGSLGGFQVLEWAAMYPELVASIAPIATALGHSAWSIAFNQVARQAIRLDPAFKEGRYPAGSQPLLGLGLARQVAMISYRSAVSFQARFGRQSASAGGGNEGALGQSDDFEVARYLGYQGVKLVERFDANTYLTITEAMDRHDVTAGRGSLADAFAGFRGPVLSLGISSDILYPTSEQRDLAAAFERLGNPTRYVEIDSPHGHDAFLIEWEQLTAALRPFLCEVAGWPLAG